jgi:type II secretory pathway pseudopilin PulG
MAEGQKKTLGIAIASLVFSCLFLIPILGILFSLTAIILGIVALVKISQDKENLQGQGLAIAGIVLGGIGIVIIPIIAILAAIAVPNFMRARISAQESAAAAAMHTITAAELAYRYDHSQYARLDQLGEASPPYIDATLAGGNTLGYTFTIVANGAHNFYAVAIPESTVSHTFYIDEDGVLCKSHKSMASVPGAHVEKGCPVGFSEKK